MRSDKYHGGVPTDRWREIRPLRPGTTHLGRRTIHDPFVAVMMLIAARTGATMMSPQRAGANAVIGSESGPGSGLTSFQGRSTPAAVLNAGDVSGVGGVLYNTTGDTPGGFFPVPGLTTSATPTTPAGNQYAVASATSNTVTVAGTVMGLVVPPGERVQLGVLRLRFSCSTKPAVAGVQETVA